MADYATLLRDHVTLSCRSVDRIFLQAYVPKLQSVGGVPVPVLAEGVRDPVVGGVRQDRRRLRRRGTAQRIPHRQVRSDRATGVHVPTPGGDI
jgi:hypothetical protein